MQHIDTYIERKKDPSKVVYPHPLLEPILKETYGIMIYQELERIVSRILFPMRYFLSWNNLRVMDLINHTVMPIA